MAYYEFLAFDDAWDHILYPWFKSLTHSPSHNRPNLVVTPHASLNSFIKQKLIQHSLSFINLHFCTPSHLRQKLTGSLSVPIKTLLREDFHLLIKYICAQFPENFLAKASCQQPEPLARFIDAVLTAGIDSTSILPEAQPLIEALLKYLLPKNILSSQLLDRKILENVLADQSLLFENTLLYGFTAQSWNHFSLLKAAFLASNKPILCFPVTTPDTFAERTWQGTWESLSAPAELLPSSKVSPYANFIEELQKVSTETPAAITAPLIKIAPEKQNEAHIIFNQISHWLNTHPGPRIGILFPEQNTSFANSLSTLLADFCIPYNNTLDSPSTPTKASHAFDALVSFWNQPLLNNFFDLLNALQAINLIEISDLLQIKEDCHKAFLAMATDNLTVILHCINSTYPEHPIHKAFETFPLLPEEDTFTNYLHILLSLLEKIDYPSSLSSVVKHAAIPQTILEKPIPKFWFLSWASDVVRMQADLYFPSNAYANIHLLTPAEALSQSWTHLIFAELENSHWTIKTKDIPLFTYSDIRNFNTSITEEGSFGTGHFIIRKNFVPLPLSSESSRLAENHFVHLLQLPTDSILCTGTQDSLSIHSSPSLLLEKILLLNKQLPTSDTSASNDFSYTSLLANRFSHRTTDACKNAYVHRQDPTQPFDAYSFSFEDKLSEAVSRISCKNWELLLTKPEVAWVKLILKVERPTDYAKEDRLSMLTGSWVHEWLCLQNAQEGEFVQKPYYKEWCQASYQKALDELRLLKNFYAAANEPMPSRLLSKWHSSWQMTQHFIKTITNCSQISSVTSEYTLPSDACIQIGNTEKIPVTGRIDFLVKDTSTDGDNLWIIDFKTGAPPPLTPNNLVQGKGLQLALYALALSNNAFQKTSCIDVSCLPPFSPLKRQCGLDELTALTQLWQILLNIYKTGKLGQREFLRFTSRSDITIYPAATVTIPNAVLSQKWKLTHVQASTK